MTEETNATSTVKSGGLPNGLLLVLFVAGWMSFGFGVVGLYEDREFLSLDSVLAVVGLVFVIASVPLLLKVSQSSVNPTSFGGSSLLILWGCVRLAIKSMNGRPWWDQAASLLFIAAGIYGVVVALRGRGKAAMDDPADS